MGHVEMCVKQQTRFPNSVYHCAPFAVNCRSIRNYVFFATAPYLAPCLWELWATYSELFSVD